MTKGILDHEGGKYLRTIHPAHGGHNPIPVDVYCVIEAFGVTCPALQHALKKIVACGQRGKGDRMADLLGIEAAVARAIELEQRRAPPEPQGGKEPWELQSGRKEGDQPTT